MSEAVSASAAVTRRRTPLLIATGVVLALVAAVDLMGDMLAQRGAKAE